MSVILKKSIELKDYMTNARRRFHQNPELGFQEYDTTKFVKAELESMGIPLQAVDIETGCIALIKGEKPGADIVTAIRADMDALPIDEKTGLEYASQNPGVMHACGHDGHMAALLGVAKLLNSMKGQFSGTVKLIFQPAEEGLGGAKEVIKKEGHLNPTPDEIIALHAWPGLSAGKIGIMPDKAMASSDTFTIRVIGRGGHGARPSEAINPVVAAANMVSAISHIVSDEIPTFDSVVISVCMFNGGKTCNVIPDDVSFSGTVRCLEEGNRHVIKAAIERIVSGIAQSSNCKYECTYAFGVSTLENDPDVNARLRQAAITALGEDNVVDVEPTMGSEDFSDLVTVVGKGSMMRLGIAAESDPYVSLHNDRFNFNDDALPAGCAVMTQFIMDKHV